MAPDPQLTDKIDVTKRAKIQTSKQIEKFDISVDLMDITDEVR